MALLLVCYKRHCCLFAINELFQQPATHWDRDPGWCAHIHDDLEQTEANDNENSVAIVVVAVAVVVVVVVVAAVVVVVVVVAVVVITIVSVLDG